MNERNEPDPGSPGPQGADPVDSANLPREDEHETVDPAEALERVADGDDPAEALEAGAGGAGEGADALAQMHEGFEDGDAYDEGGFEEAYAPALAGHGDEASAAVFGSHADDSGESRQPRRRAPKPPSTLARNTVKACIVIGMLLLVPALWSIAVLVGLPVPRSGSSGATAVALFMLTCWPVAGLLIGGAVFYNRQHAEQMAAIARFEEEEAELAGEGGDDEDAVARSEDVDEAPTSEAGDGVESAAGETIESVEADDADERIGKGDDEDDQTQRSSEFSI